MAGSFDPSGTVYKNHEALSFAVREAAGQFIVLVFALAMLGLAVLAFATAPTASTLRSVPFVLPLAVGASVGVAIIFILRSGTVRCPRSIRVGNGGIVAYFGHDPDSSDAASGIILPYASMTRFGHKQWEFHQAGKAAWYDFDPPQVRFNSGPHSVPKRLQADPADPEEGVIYLTDENLTRVREACEAWRQKERADSPSKANVENEMDDATAAALGEI